MELQNRFAIVGAGKTRFKTGLPNPAYEEGSEGDFVLVYDNGVRRLEKSVKAEVSKAEPSLMKAVVVPSLEVGLGDDMRIELSDNQDEILSDDLQVLLDEDSKSDDN